MEKIEKADESPGTVKDNNSPLMKTREFAEYMQISFSYAKKLLANPECKYRVKIGRNVYAYRPTVDNEIARCAKYQIPFK